MCGRAAFAEICDDTNQAVGVSLVFAAWNSAIVLGPALGGKGKRSYSISKVYPGYKFNSQRYSLKVGINSPLDTGRKLNVEKTFRRRLECFLKVLWTFNLRPVPRELGVATWSSYSTQHNALFS